MRSAKLTINNIFFFLLAIFFLVLSYNVTAFKGGLDQQGSPKEQLARPLFRLPVGEAAAESVFFKNAPPKNELSAQEPGGAAEAALPQIFAGAAVAFDISSGKAYFSQNADALRPVASITKLLSAALVIDNALLEAPVTVSASAVASEGDAGNLRPGEVLSVDALLHAALLESSNDAIMALAEHVGASLQQKQSSQAVKKFVIMMNEKAQAVGLLDSRFTDPSGLEDKESFSTANDLVKLISYLRWDSKYSRLWQILARERAEFSSQDGFGHTFFNNNTLVPELSGVIGGKTGYTARAGESLVLLARSPDEVSEIAYIVLGSADRFGDMRKLIDWVNNNYSWLR